METSFDNLILVKITNTMAINRHVNLPDGQGVIIGTEWCNFMSPGVIKALVNVSITKTKS